MSVGVAKTTHYCMGREKSTNIFSFESEKCPCSLFLAENSPCCDDEHEVLIVDDSQTQTTSLAPVSPEFFELGDVLHAKSEQIFVYASTQFISADFSPPPKEPLFKINCSFVFYESELS
jgi:hypothetical protein